jgi:Tfp pilus assembly protein PilF/SAM-dependent methyltransferase
MASADAAAALDTALRAHQRGDLKQAEALYRRVLSAEPGNTQALQYFGLLREHQGDLDGAEEAYRVALARAPTNVAVLNRLATTLGRLERYTEAEAHLRTALDHRPEFAAAWTTLGNVLEGQGRFDDATAAFERALDLDPDGPRAHNNLGIVRARQGRLDEAERHYRRAVELDPDFADALGNLGSLLSRRGAFTEALDWYRRALELDPDSPAILTSLGQVMAELGEQQSAQDLYSRALAIDADLPAARIGLVTILAKGGLDRYQPAIDRFLTTAFGWPDIDGDILAPLAARHLKLKYGLPETPHEMAEANLDDGLVARLAGDRLLAAFLRAAINRNAGLEVLLVRLRRRLADDPALADRPPLFALAAALAEQCGANEYVFAVTDEEAGKVDLWRRELEAVDDWSAPTPAAQALLLRYCLYAAPRALACRDRLAAPPPDRWQPALQPLIAEELVNREREAALAAGLPELTPISDAFPHFEPPDSLRGPVDVLIAGCGTGQHPIAEAALIYKEAAVLAVDLSRASLGYAARKAADLEAGNVDFAVADILELDGLDRQFDVIEAGGVLHHLRDPVAGWRILRDRLRPGGVMMVALYSQRSRRHIAALRAARDDLGLSATADGIRGFRRRLMFDDALAPYRGLLDSPDFYSMSGCRDLAFHVEEHQFGPNEIADILDRLELELIGLQHATPEPARHYRAAYPDDPTQTDLANWDRFEEAHPKTFAQMIRIWCRRRPMDTDEAKTPL